MVLCNDLTCRRKNSRSVVCRSLDPIPLQRPRQPFVCLEDILLPLSGYQGTPLAGISCKHRAIIQVSMCWTTSFAVPSMKTHGPR